MASTAEYQAGFHCFREALSLVGNFFLLFSWEVDKGIIFCANKEWNGGFVEATTLTIPLFDRIESTLTSEVKHKENGDSIVADEWQHVDEFALTTQVPDGESDLSVPN